MKSSAAKTLLLVTVGNLSRDGDEGGVVAKGMMDLLNRELKDLDPSRIDFTKTGILGKVFDLALRPRLGVRNSSHTLAKLPEPAPWPQVCGLSR